MKRFSELYYGDDTLPLGEDAAANAVSHGGVAGLNQDPPKWRKKFAGMECFEVDEDRYTKARMGKNRYHRWETYAGDDEIGQAIKEYGKTNPKASILLQNSKTGGMMYLRKGRK